MEGSIYGPHYIKKGGLNNESPKTFYFIINFESFSAWHKQVNLFIYIFNNRARSC